MPFGLLLPALIEARSLSVPKIAAARKSNADFCIFADC